MTNKIIEVQDYMIVMKLLLDGKARIVQEISDETKIQYVHIFNIKKALLKLNWIYIFKIGKRHNIQLTDKGKNVAKLINELLIEIDSIKKNEKSTDLNISANINNIIINENDVYDDDEEDFQLENEK